MVRRILRSEAVLWNKRSLDNSTEKERWEHKGEQAPVGPDFDHDPVDRYRPGSGGAR